MRRKGERPIVREVEGWSDSHPVARAIRRGDWWFGAWMRQMCTPYQRLAKLTQIEEGRLAAIDHGEPVTRAEIAALAGAWWVTPEGLIESIGDAPIID